MKKTVSRIFSRILPVFLALFGVVTLQIFSEGTAFASTHLAPPHHVTKIVEHMKVVKVLNATKTSNNEVTPNNTVTGDCGTIEFYIEDQGNNVAEFFEYVDSSLGPIESLSYSVSWRNWDANLGSQFGSSFISPSNPWENADFKITGNGFVTASLFATDIVGGQECQGSASDANDITD